MAELMVYTDGAFNWDTRTGGWAVVIAQDSERRRLSGNERDTTNNRMELTAAIRALEALPEGAAATVVSDSEYLVKTMQGRYRRKANLDLWANLDALTASRKVRWQWVEGHTGHPGNEEANALAEWEAAGRKGLSPPSAAVAPQGEAPPPQPALSHLDQQGRARMVDVGEKPMTHRVAIAKGSITMRPETLSLIAKGGLEKGDAVAVARLAGVMAAKQTPHLIPLCHPIPLDQVTVDLELDDEASAVHITATASAVWRTGVEMEALTAVMGAALALYDMAKAVDRTMRISDVRLVRKSGGRSGDLVLEE
ncbi:MAG: cyclic pyranopterin monophosphate synthase MoaC [Chloroflexi bacterium]|nr:cyclic pyranopterin monophosphate synthase MoaC [Chloroflexota bacterium]